MRRTVAKKLRTIANPRHQLGINYRNLKREYTRSSKRERAAILAYYEYCKDEPAPS